MKRLKCLAALLAVTVGLSAQARAQADGDFQAWSALFVAGPPAEQSRLLLWFDGHARFTGDASDLGVSIIRPGLGWRVSDRLDVWAGYARVVARPEGAPNVEENRIWQQATYPIADVLGGALSGRTRLEQRLREAGEDTGWRARQFLRWERRFAGSPVSALVSNELFINFNDADWGQQSGFDQNRFFAGGAWRLSGRVRLESGYLNNHLNLAGPGSQTNHNIFAAMFLSL